MAEVDKLDHEPLQDERPTEEDVNNNQEVKDDNNVPAEGEKKSNCLSTVYVLNDELSITVTDPEEWLCISRLPLDLTADEFLHLVEEFGSVERTLLIHSDRTGKFKGYAIVLYSRKSASLQARHVLEGRVMRGGHALDCDWLKRHSSIERVSLHSKCLFIDNLPEDYRDMGGFRKLFSTIVNPPYCQIAMKNGVLQKWGLVEFDSSQTAEETLEKINGYSLQGKNLRVQYCIPGVHAINIYMAFINNPMDAVSEGKALLEEIPSTKVYDQLQSLAKHNPWFVQSLKNIMTTSMTQQDQNQQPSAPPVSKLHVIPSAPLPPPPAGADPAQAALILLLASKVTAKSVTPAQTAIMLQGIIKQLEKGVPAADILENLAENERQTGESDTPAGKVNGDKRQNLGNLISTLLHSAQTMLNNSTNRVQSPANPAGTSTDPKKKNPKLMDLLFKSFQARVKNGIYSPRERNNNNIMSLVKSSTTVSPKYKQSGVPQYSCTNLGQSKSNLLVPAAPTPGVGTFQPNFAPVIVPPPPTQQLLPCTQPATPHQPSHTFQTYTDTLGGTFGNTLFIPNAAIPVLPPTSITSPPSQLLTWQTPPPAVPAPPGPAQLNLSADPTSPGGYGFAPAVGHVPGAPADFLMSEMQNQQQQLAAAVAMNGIYNPYFSMGISNTTPDAMNTPTLGGGNSNNKRKLDPQSFFQTPGSGKQMKLVS